MFRPQSASKKIVFNTTILLTRLVISTVLVLFSTRIVLRALGSSDYGLLNLLVGLLIMLAFLNSAMSSSTQRFLSFNQGKDPELLRKIFTNSLYLHIIIAIVVVILIQITGLFLFNGILNIPSNRMDVARQIFHILSFSIFCNIVSVPFVGAVNAHEDQVWSAFASLLESILKLVTAYYLLYTHHDKLLVYGYLLAGIAFVIFLLNALFASSRYKECRIQKLHKMDKTLVKEMTSFAGWNLFGIVCSLGRSQGVAILLNRFFGTIVNASYGISTQIASQLNYFSDTLLHAIDPQIMRSEGTGDRRRVLDLSMLASKYGVFIMASAGIPIMFEMPAVLHLWLDEVPPYTIIFCDLTILAVLMNQETIGLQSAAQAIGKIKVYQMIIGTLLLLNLPIAYVFLKLGFKPYWTILVFVFIEAIACWFRLFFLKKLGGLSVKEYIQKVYLKQVMPIVLNILVCLGCVYFFHFQGRLFLTLVVSFLSFVGFIFMFGMNNAEKSMAREMLFNIKNKYFPQKK